jgi:uncharacterized membrane protein YsdA (DUF1294 family)
MVPLRSEEIKVSRLGRTFLCILIGFVCAYVGFLAVAIFWPLLFPLSLVGRSTGENALVVAMPAISLLFGAGGFLLGQRATRHCVRQDDGSSGKRLLR